MKVKASVSVLALSVALASGSAMAFQQGDMFVRAGAAAVDPQEDSSQLALNGTSLQDALGIDSSAGVDSNTQLGLTFTYMVSNKVGIEVLAATPFTHTVTANLGGTTVEAAEVTHLPPTVSAVFYPMGAGSAFQPYVGIGINYTTFFDEEVASELDAVTTSLGLGDAQGLDLDDSFGFAFQIGCDFMVSENLLINAAVRKIDIDTTATFSYAGGNEITADVGIDPLVYMVGAGYKF